MHVISVWQPSKSFSMIDVASSRHSLIWNYIVVPVAYSVSNLWNGSASSLDVREMRTASALINHAIINTMLMCFSFSPPLSPLPLPPPHFGLFENETRESAVSRKYSDAQFRRLFSEDRIFENKIIEGCSNSFFFFFFPLFSKWYTFEWKKERSRYLIFADFCKFSNVRIWQCAKACKNGAD